MATKKNFPKIYHDDNDQETEEGKEELEVMDKVETPVKGDIYWTSDLGLAAVFLTQQSLVDIDNSVTRRYAFGFKADGTQEVTEKAYWNKELKVEPQAYYFALLQLRKRINQLNYK